MMRRYILLLLVVGAILLIMVAVSWVVFPQWRADPVGAISFIVATIGGIVATLKGVIDLLRAWRDLGKPEKKGGEPPLQNITPEDIRGDLGRGGQVGYINREVTDENLLYQHPKVFITGKMKVGKTREAAEVIQRAIDDDLVPIDQVYEPSQTLRALGTLGIREALRWEIDTGKRVLLFIDELPKQILPREEDKWSALLKALNRTPEHYVVATGRNDQITPDQDEWLEKEGFHTIELKGLEDDEIEKLVLEAADIFGLRISQEARKVFVEASDGRPETTLICMRRLANTGSQEIDQGTAREIAKDGLEAAWMKTLSYLEAQYPGVKYWLDALGTLHSANVHTNELLVRDYANELWQKERSWVWRRGKLLDEALEKLGDYEIVVRGGIIRYPEISVEGRMDAEKSIRSLEKFLESTNRERRLPIGKKVGVEKLVQAWALYDLARVAEVENRKQEAIHLYSEAIKRLPIEGFYINRGDIYSDLGQHRQAIADYCRAIKANQKSSMAYYRRGHAHAILGENKQAMADFDKAINLNPESAVAYFIRGVEYDFLGDYKRAIADFEQAIKLNPEYAESYYYRGKGYAALEQHERAIENYDQAIKLNPELAAAYNERGRSYAALGQHDRALEDYDQVIKLNPEDPVFYSNRGISYAALDQHERAIEDFDQAIELDPDHDAAYYNKACSYARQGMHEEALEWLKQAIDLDTNTYCDLAKGDSDLDGIRNSADYQELMEEKCNG